MENGLLQEVGTHQQLLARKGSIMPFIVSKMPQSTDSSPVLLIRFRVKPIYSGIFKIRRKVFFDSPGLLEQSQHWGGLVI